MLSVGKPTAHVIGESALFMGQGAWMTTAHSQVLGEGCLGVALLPVHRDASVSPELAGLPGTTAHSRE